tara:strand:- start:1133 stop:2098 length:966 start_codon:yes stop_codon:yes gene_type:complete
MKVFIGLKVSLSQAYMIALMDSYQPKVVLSFADQNQLLGLYQLYRDEVLVISVQNAVRHPHQFLRLAQAPHFFALGSDARRNFDKYQIPYKQCLASGSLPLGIFCSRNSINKCPGKLVFVSSYRFGFDHTNPDQAVDEYTSAQERAHSLVFRHALRYAKQSNRVLTVIAKGKVRYEGQHFAEEKAYFERLAGENEFTLSSTVKDTFNSYHQVLTAEFIIGLDSTLLYEAFSVGARVLFCWGADQYLIENAGDLIERLPKPVLLESSDYADFFEKADFARGLSDQAYKSMIAAGQSEYVNSSQYFPVHEKLKQEINAHLGRA